MSSLVPRQGQSAHFAGRPIAVSVSTFLLSARALSGAVDERDCMDSIHSGRSAVGGAAREATTGLSYVSSAGIKPQRTVGPESGKGVVGATEGGCASFSGGGSWEGRLHRQRQGSAATAAATPSIATPFPNSTASVASVEVTSSGLKCGVTDNANGTTTASLHGSTGPRPLPPGLHLASSLQPPLQLQLLRGVFGRRSAVERVEPVGPVLLSALSAISPRPARAAGSDPDQDGAPPNQGGVSGVAGGGLGYSRPLGTCDRQSCPSHYLASPCPRCHQGCCCGSMPSVYDVDPTLLYGSGLGSTSIDDLLYCDDSTRESTGSSTPSNRGPETGLGVPHAAGSDGAPWGAARRSPTDSDKAAAGGLSATGSYPCSWKTASAIAVAGAAGGRHSHSEPGQLGLVSPPRSPTVGGPHGGAAAAIVPGGGAERCSNSMRGSGPGPHDGGLQGLAEEVALASGVSSHTAGRRAADAASSSAAANEGAAVGTGLGPLRSHGASSHRPQVQQSTHLKQPELAWQRQEPLRELGCGAGCCAVQDGEGSRASGSGCGTDGAASRGPCVGTERPGDGYTEMAASVTGVKCPAQNGSGMSAQRPCANSSAAAGEGWPQQGDSAPSAAAAAAAAAAVGAANARDSCFASTLADPNLAQVGRGGRGRSLSASRPLLCKIFLGCVLHPSAR